MDPLTGMLNRRGFAEATSRVIEREANAGRPVTVLIFDIDHFKSINDSYGHLAGDEVLKAVAAVAESCLCDGDSLSRVGGEEFALIVPAPLAGAVGRAETVRRAIERHALKFGDTDVRVTVSLGVAELAPGEAQDAFYQRADARLYDSKHLGRNRVSS
jgi:diguanylate cyclase (GGDEF)-like protein